MFSIKEVVISRMKAMDFYEIWGFTKKGALQKPLDLPPYIFSFNILFLSLSIFF